MVTDMLKHLRLFAVTYRFWLMRNLEFRRHVLVWSITSIVWGLLGLWMTNLIFGQVSAIAGWTQGEALLLVATQALFNSFLWLFILPSLLDLSESIRDGKFDLVLSKPVASRFLVSIRKFEFGNYGRIVVMATVMPQITKSFGINVDFFSLLGFAVMFIIGLFIYYCFFLMLTTLNFWFIRIDNLEDLFDTLVVMGRYPTQVFTSGLRLLFYYLIPLAFVATFPVSVLLKKAGWELVVVGFVIAAVFYWTSNRFWNFALRHYSSASS